MAIGANTLTLNGTIVGLNKNQRNIIADGSSNLNIGGSGAFGTLFFDQTTAGTSQGGNLTGTGSDLYPGTTNRLNNFTFNRTSQTITLGNEMQVNNTVTPTAGTLASNGNLVMLSTSTVTSSILALPATGAAITGDVVVQSFFLGGTVAANRGFRMISSPVVDIAPPSNFFSILKQRFIVTGQGAVSSGFDVNPNNAPNAPTITRYVETGAIGVTSFSTIPNIGTATIPGKGYYFFFRGNRSNLNSLAAGKINVPFSAPEDWTAAYIGTVNTGDVSIGVTNTAVDAMDGFNLLGNPYPGTLDFQAFRDDAANVGVISDYLCIMNRNRTGFVTQSGRVTNGTVETAPSNSGSVTSAGLGIIRYIQPGQGFFVRKTSAGAGSVTFRESHKANAANSPGATRLLSVREDIAKSEARKLIRMSIVGDGNRDDATVVLEAGNAPGFGGYDAPYLSNSSVACYTLTSDDKAACINFMPSVEEVDSLRIFVTSGNALTEATLNFGDLTGADYKEVQLVDKHLNSVTKIGAEANSYAFAMDKSKPTSFGRDRFVLRFVKPAIRLGSFSAKVDGNRVQLKWETLSEQNLAKNFEVERSVDGTNFELIGVRDAAGNSANPVKYSMTDGVPPTGTIYYRLRLNASDGTHRYGGVETVDFGIGNDATMTIYPNPADGELNVTWKTARRVDIVIYDMSGRVVKTFRDREGKYCRINVGGLEKGVYVLRLKGDNGEVGSNKFTKL